ncbi:MAG: hypothetical protein ABI534_05380 [Chloroflexota bacterium]
MADQRLDGLRAATLATDGVEEFAEGAHAGRESPAAAASSRS